MVLGPGFHRIPKDVYLADPCAQPSLTASIAHTLISESPEHAWAAHPRGGALREDPTAAMVRGTILDSVLLGGDTELIGSPYADYRTKEARAWRDTVLAAGQLPVKGPELEAARTAADAITDRLQKLGIALDGQHQVTGVWQDGDVWCRMRMDHWQAVEGVIYDLKICDSAHPRAVSRKMDAFGYDVQRAAYISGVEAIMPDLAGRVRMVFIFAEPEPPYSVVVCQPNGELRAIGLAKWQRAVKTWGMCLATGRWPGYADSVVEIEPAPWAMTELMNDVKGGSKDVAF